MPRPFKLAIVGCGQIAASHVEAALTSSQAELMALVDPAPDRAAALAERFNLEVTIARSLAEVERCVDGAIVATPNHTHADLAERCLEAGLSVLIEKPLAIGVEEGERICESARRTGGIVALGYVSRFRTNIRLMADLIDEGYFGRISRFAYQFGTRGGWAPMSGYNLDRRMSGGGVLVTSGTHFLDRMLDWFGYPDEAHLIDDAVGGPEANAAVYVKYHGPDGLSGTARFSKTVPMPGGFVMETERGMVMLADRADASILLRSADRPNLEVEVRRRVHATEPCDNEFVRQLDDFVEASRERRPPTVTAEQGLQSLRLLDHLYRNRSNAGEDWYAMPSSRQSA